MNFPWWGRYRLRITQKRDVVRRRLQYETTKSLTEMQAKRLLFSGTVGEERFRICRSRIESKASDMCVRDSGSPILHGYMYENGEETVIDIRWHLSIFSIIFATAWLMGVGFGLYITWIDGDQQMILLVGAMFCGGLWAFFPGVGSSVKRAKKTLIDVLVAPGESWYEE